MLLTEHVVGVPPIVRRVLLELKIRQFEFLRGQGGNFVHKTDLSQKKMG
jgi:hypothetical protein